MKTDHLIDALVADSPVREAGHPAITLGIGVLGAAILFLALFGIRSGWDTAHVLLATGFKLLFTLISFVTAYYALQGLARPVRETGVPWILPIALGVVVVGGISWDLASAGLVGWQTRLMGDTALRCLTLVTIFSFVPLLAFLLFLSRNAPLNAGRAGAVAGLAAAGIGASLHALGCPQDSPLFVLTWYSLAGVIVAGLGMVLARLTVRW